MQTPFPTHTICDVPVTDFSYEEAVGYCLSSIRENRKLQIVTAAAETIVTANALPAFMKLVKLSSLNTADGMGLVWAGEKLFNKKIRQITGVELAYRLLQACEKEGYTVFLLGAKEETITKTVAKLKEQLPKLRIVGYRNGYYETTAEEKILEEIKSSNADVILVALGMPKQDLWIYKHLASLPCKVAIGVGGTFDVWSGNMKRAPKWISELKLEWVYRILTDFTKLKRGKAQFQFIKMVKQQKNKQQ